MPRNYSLFPYSKAGTQNMHQGAFVGTKVPFKRCFPKLLVSLYHFRILPSQHTALLGRNTFLLEFDRYLLLLQQNQGTYNPSSDSLH